MGRFTVADDHAEAAGTASYITAAPEGFLTAIARLVADEKETRAQFEAEPTTITLPSARSRVGSLSG